MWQKRINVAVIVLTSLLVASVVFPLIQHHREAARRAQSKNNLKQLGLALHNYESTYGGFPPGGVFNSEGRGFHGWMTFILPFVDDSPFYNYVNFNSPWDSTQNAGLFLNTMPCYENLSEPAERRHWEFPVAHYSVNPHLMAVNSFVKLKSIETTTQVFFAGELNGGFVPWGCPYNWRELESLNSKTPVYGRSTRDGCFFLFVDGRVEFIANEVSKDVLKRMNGDDLSEFNVTHLSVQFPSTFHCPADALWFTWSYVDGGRIEIKRDIQGKVRYQAMVRGK